MTHNDVAFLMMSMWTVKFWSNLHSFTMTCALCAVIYVTFVLSYQHTFVATNLDLSMLSALSKVTSVKIGPLKFNAQKMGTLGIDWDRQTGCL